MRLRISLTDLNELNITGEEDMCKMLDWTKILKEASMSSIRQFPDYFLTERKLMPLLVAFPSVLLSVCLLRVHPQREVLVILLTTRYFGHIEPNYAV